MDIACCDPAKLPKSTELVNPNRLQIPNTTWRGIDIKHPAIVIPVTEGSVIYAVPGNFKTAITLTQAEYFPGRGGYVYLPAPGPWYLYNDSGADRSFIVMDCSTAAAFLAIAGVRLIGSGGAADVRDADGVADFAKALLGLEVNARVAFYSTDSSDWVLGTAVTPNNIQGDGFNDYNGLVVNAVLQGKDLTAGGNGLIRAPEARSLTNLDNVSGTLISLVTGSFPFIYDPVGTTYHRASGLREGTVAGAVMAQGVLDMRASGYWAALRARRYIVTPEANAAMAISVAAFVATDPQVLIVVPATNEWILRRIFVQPFDAVTAGQLKLAVVASSDNKYSSGGTSFIPAGPGGFRVSNTGSATALVPTQARTNSGAAIVATAAGANDQTLGEFAVQDGEDPITFELEDGFLLAPGSTLMLFLTGAASIEFLFRVELESADVQ